MFAGRRLCIATKHEKERVIAPVVERALGVTCFVAEGLDTDQLGTFSGEVVRPYDPLTTAREKCRMAMELTRCDLAIASEGSFGPHPSLVFIPADEEILLFMDALHGLEIWVREISAETNFSGAAIHTTSELLDFADRVKFPSHGVILKDRKEGFTEVVKGITDMEQLQHSYASFIQRYGSCFIETDMRALYNPTRMRVISQAVEALVAKIGSQCPACHTPGFGITAARPGLPCDYCARPTRSVLSYIYSCQKCAFTREELYPKGIQTEDPMYCDACNP